VRQVKHHAALPWAEAASFMAELAGQPGTAALTLRFAVLTAARTREVIGARWAEIDMPARTWTIPAARMKAGREHRVPLSDLALAILRTVAEAGSGPEAHVFPGAKPGRGLSNMALAMVLRRMKRVT
jgi:integrase